MGFDLSAAVAGYNGYKNADRQARTDEYIQAQRDYQAATNAEQRAGAPSRANALALQDARNSADMALVDPAAEARRAQLEGLSADMAFQKTQRPMTQATTIQLNQNAATDAGTTGLMSDATARLAPGKITAALTTGAIDVNTARLRGMAAVGQSLAGGDIPAATALAQELSANTDIFPGLKGKTIGKITASTGANGEQMVNIASDSGELLGAIPYKAFTNAIEQTKAPQKATMTQVRPSNALVSTDARGNTREVYNNPRAATDAGANLTSLQKNVAFMMRVDGITEQEALQKARTGVHDDKFTTVNKLMKGNKAMDYEKNPAVRAAVKKGYEDEWEAFYGKGNTNSGTGLSDAPGSGGVPANVLKLFPVTGLK